MQDLDLIHYTCIDNYNMLISLTDSSGRNRSLNGYKNSKRLMLLHLLNLYRIINDIQDIPCRRHGDWTR